MNVEMLAEQSGRNSMLVTVLTPIIGYDLAGRIAAKALSEGRLVMDVARELTALSEEELTT